MFKVSELCMISELGCSNSLELSPELYHRTEGIGLDSIDIKVKQGKYPIC